MDDKNIYDKDLQLLKLKEENLALRKDNVRLSEEVSSLHKELDNLKKLNEGLFNEIDRVSNDSVKPANNHKELEITRKTYSENSLGLFKIEDCEDMLLLYSDYMTGTEIVREMEMYISAEAFYAWTRDYNFKCVFGALNDKTLKTEYNVEFDEQTKRNIIHELLELRIKDKLDIPIEVIIKRYL